MKILTIEFQNINSLKEKHEIDFSKVPFSSNSLFAITGPTGSGKSTILDVISLALFNQVPRLGKISKNEILNKGAILTRNQKEAYAKITYECKNGIYASMWSISTNRNGNLRDYEMQIFELSTGKALDLKKSDVPARNEDLIGLNYEQFIKAVLLAQGEFAQFLKAKKDERGELLEKLTGTGVYRQLGIKAFQEKKEVFSEIENEQQEIGIHRKNLLEEEDHKSTSQELLEKEKCCTSLEKKTEQLKQQLQLKKEIEEREKQIGDHLKKKAEAAQMLQKFEVGQGLQLQKHEKIRLFGEELNLWKQLKNNCEELRSGISDNLKNIEKNSGEIEACLDNIRQFIQQEVQADTVEKQLQNFSEKVRKLQQLREEKASTYKAVKKEFEFKVREVPFQLNGNLETAEEKLKEMQATSKAKLEELTFSLPVPDLQDPVLEKEQLRKKLETARKAEQQWGKLKNLAEELKRIRFEVENITPHLEELPKSVDLDEAHAERMKERLEKLQLRKENENLRRSLKDHRHKLQNGEPCPLCGALEHPFAQELPVLDEGLQQEITITEKELHAKQQQITESKTSLALYKKRLEELQQNEQSNLKVQQALKSNFEAQFGSYKEDFNWDEYCTNLGHQINILEKYEQEDRKLNAISAGLPVIKTLQTVLSEGLEIKAQLDEIYTGENVNNDCFELQKNWSELQHRKSSYKRIAEEHKIKLTSKNDQLKQLEARLFPKVQKEGCTEISEALERLLPDDIAAKLRKKKEELCNETTITEASIQTLQQELNKLQAKYVEEPLDKIKEELRKNQEEFQEVGKVCEELRRKLNNHKDTLKRINSIEEGLVEKKQKIRRWELLNHLIGDSTGKKFNDFAQDLSLSQLLELANIRLKDLSDRYRIDKPAEGEDDSLVAIDEHMGGQRRSVKTLSGGETFILSLSMALALSDLASKNVEINSLFIDEGFGTLDPETLDQTLDTLEKLQAEASKTIGIISHVDSLKERIATQIQITRNGQGYSSLQVSG